MSRPRLSGFTLIELLVALVLLGAMSVLLFNGLWLGLRTWEAVGSRARDAQDLHLAMRFVAVQVEQARELSGEPHGLELISPLPPQLGAGGLAAWRIGAERGEAGERRLVARFPREEVVLARGLRDLQFAYRAAAAESAEWAPRWDGALGLPALVRVRLVPESAAAGVPPDLIVAPRLRDVRDEP